MGRPGRKRRLVLEDEYWALIASGVGTGEACRQLGIARTTGYYWRTQRGGLPRATVAEHARSSRYLSLLERERIAVLRQQGLGVKEIARRLDRSPSTISRELRRNMLPGDQGVYHAGLAHARSREQARRTRVGVFARDEQLKQLVQDKLQGAVEPGADRRVAPHRAPGPAGVACLSRDHLSGHLLRRRAWSATGLGAKPAHGRGLRLRRRPAKGRRPRFTVHSRMIDERPAVVEERSRLGDFEGDLIVGRHGLSAIGTLVDRTTRLVRLVHLPDARHGEATARPRSFAAVSDLPMLARRTLTWDQGS